MSDDLVERLSTEAKIWPRSDISGLLRESTTEIERLRAERDALRESNKALHRRCQQAESAVPEYRKILALPPNGDGVRFVNGSLGRIFANAACEKLSAENDALRATIDGAPILHAQMMASGRVTLSGPLPADFAGKRVALVVVE